MVKKIVALLIILLLFSCSDTVSTGGVDDMDNFIRGKVDNLKIKSVTLSKIVNKNSSFTLQQVATTSVNLSDSSFIFEKVENGEYIINGNNDTIGFVYYINFDSNRTTNNNIINIKSDTAKLFNITYNKSFYTYIPTVLDSISLLSQDNYFYSYPGLLPIYISKDCSQFSKLVIDLNDEKSSGVSINSNSVSDGAKSYNFGDTIANIYAKSSTPNLIPNLIIPIEFNFLENQLIFINSSKKLKYYIEYSDLNKSVAWVYVPLFKGDGSFLTTVMKGEDSTYQEFLYNNDYFQRSYNFSHLGSSYSSTSVKDLSGRDDLLISGKYNFQLGVYGNCLNLMGGYAYSYNDLKFDQFTTLMWVKINNDQSKLQSSILYSYYKFFKRVKFVLTDKSKLELSISINDSQYVTYSTLNTIDIVYNWHQYGFSYNDNTKKIKIYVDGISVPIKNIIVEQNDNKKITKAIEYIGTDSSLQSSFNGKVDQFRIYNIALNDDYVRVNHLQELPSNQFLEIRY